MKTDAFEVLVIGAGVVGLAAGAALARAGRQVLVVESEPGLGRGITSRNSQVVHAGLYYPTDSEKSRLCVRGRELLYERCRREGLPHRVLGKLVVAVDHVETEELERLLKQGRANGVADLELIDGVEVGRREPAVRAVAALVSPQSGIVDAHALCLSLAAELEALGGVLALATELCGLELRSTWNAALRTGGGTLEEFAVPVVINAAGLASDQVASMAGLDVDALGLRIQLCKGDYFALVPGAPIRVGQLVYPVPARAGLGVHATLDLAGRIRFGPDVEYVDEPSFAVAPEKAVAFAEVAGRYLPGLAAEWLAPDQAGIRPKLAGPGEGFRDFHIAEASAHGAPGLVNLMGIESPGLTAALAIGERVVELVG